MTVGACGESGGLRVSHHATGSRSVRRVRHQVDKTHSTVSPAIRGWETHRHAKSAGVRDVAAEANGSGGHGESSHCFASQNDGGAQKNRLEHVVRDAFSITRRGSLFPALFRLERMPRSYGISQTKTILHYQMTGSTLKSKMAHEKVTTVGLQPCHSPALPTHAGSLSTRYVAGRRVRRNARRACGGDPAAGDVQRPQAARRGH